MTLSRSQIVMLRELARPRESGDPVGLWIRHYTNRDRTALALFNKGLITKAEPWDHGRGSHTHWLITDAGLDTIADCPHRNTDPPRSAP